MSAVKRAILSGVILLVLSGWARPAQAAIPFIDVRALGIELCPQSLCGAAIFVGLLHGEVGPNPNALGTFALAATHEDLPTEQGEPARLQPTGPGGAFDIRFGLRRIRGEVVTGFIFRVFDDVGIDTNTFIVFALLLTSEGDLIEADVLLDHNVFPPRVSGRVFSELGPSHSRSGSTHVRCWR